MGDQADARPRSLTPGFLLDRGRYTTIEVPGATVETAPLGINNLGQIVGTARGGGRPDRGFLRDARGRITTIRFPGARSTTAQKLNDRGQLTGYYSTTTDDPRDGAIRPGSCWTAAATPPSRSPARSPPPRSGSTTAPRWSASTRPPTAASTAMCGSGGASPRSTFPAPPGPRWSTSTIAASSWALCRRPDRRPGTVHGFVWDRGRLRSFDGPAGTLLPAWRPQQPRPDRGRHHRPRHRDGPRVPAGQGRQGPLHPDPIPRRARAPSRSA